MSFTIGLDIGGTKLAGGLFAENGKVLAQASVPTPVDYADFLRILGAIVEQLDNSSGVKPTIGIGAAGMIDRDKGTVFAPNIMCLENRPFRDDCEKLFERAVRLANDADCAALAESVDGAGRGYRSMFGLVLGTGVGGGLILDGKLMEGPHGLAAEIGHLPLPFREAGDGPMIACGCGQKGCIDKSIGGPALVRLNREMTGKELGAALIAERARKGEAEALRVLDRFYTVVAKALVTVIHAFDPEIIVVSGGLNDLPGLYEEVPKKWGTYALCKSLKTKFVPAMHGSMSGMRGAALIGD